MSVSVIRDSSLAPEGKLKIEWARAHMPLMMAIEREFVDAKPFAGKRIVVCCHLEAKTARLAMALAVGGASVAVTGSNPLSTQDDVAAALAETPGVDVYAWHGSTGEEYLEHLSMALGDGADVLMDDGGDLVSMVHTSKRALLPRISGGCEETTTGLCRLRAMASAGKLGFPMIAVNDAKMKHLFDNRYGTGQSAWDGIMRTTNLSIAGSTVVVAGYGWCGKGLAMRARGLGANVIVTEVDPVAACEARMDGFRVMPMERASAEGGFFVTATGCRDVIRGEHFALMRDGAVLANAGHFDVEISKPDLAAACPEPPRTVRRNIQEYRMYDGRRLYLLAEGRLVNLAAGDGHPIEVMDMSFGIQALSIRHIIRCGGDLAPGVLPVPAEVDEKVARLALDAAGISIDSLSLAQRGYLAGWESGTARD
ncbi:MAG: adenosylhomocysteinase [Clostridia bacterium]|nr:adenosylhomocysteinase [Clostridia bacterium]